MKNILPYIIFLLLLSGASLFAQRDLKVAEFYEDAINFSPKSLAFNHNGHNGGEFVVIDGDTCAAIIVTIPSVIDATFQPAYKVEYKNNKYHVWVPTKYINQGRKFIIRSVNYRELVYILPEPLKPATTYQMIIDVPPIIRIDTLYNDRKSKWSYDASLIAGQAVGVGQDFTISYFLIGFGVDFFLVKTKGWTKQTTLFNSGYTGNFIREKKVTLNGTCPHLFADVGMYFKYVSVSCQVGILFCKETLTDLSYSGNGEGIQDEYIDQHFGEYGYYTFETSNTEKDKKYFTISPLIKGYIPIDGRFGLTVGIGYTFIPAVYAGAAWGSVGVHVKF